MYDKVFLNAVMASQVYKESVKVTNNGKVVLRAIRPFREYFGQTTSEEEEGIVILKGRQVGVHLSFPGWVPKKDPLENWFQIALKTENPLLADPLNCKSRYRGVLPGRLRDGILGIPSEFTLEAEPRYADFDYALFIYDSADYEEFVNGARKLIHGSISNDRKILISDSSKQPMLLIPTSFLIGGKDHLTTMWEKLIENHA